MAPGAGVATIVGGSTALYRRAAGVFTPTAQHGTLHSVAHAKTASNRVGPFQNGGEWAAVRP